MYRNPAQLAVLCNLCADLVGRFGRASIHVFAESTGEETYSLAMELSERGLLAACDLSASDNGVERLRRAPAGYVQSRDLIRIPERCRERYLRQVDAGIWQIAAGLRAGIRHWRVDVREAISADQPYDVVLMQNVLPHLDAAEQQKALANVSRVNAAGGLLAIGAVQPKAFRRLLGDLGYEAIETEAQAIYDGWSTQRRAWTCSPRPHWALPPAEPAATAADIASLFRKTR